MLSVILYGRNDAHGYNLHKRAAISLNCIAEMLSDADDEILFVDYNTPNDLPTFIEAIYDTLTQKAKSRLRVFRVRPELHARMIKDRTHLFALEPHSRNIAIRRSNPRNRWLLFTNTDMIFLPKSGVSDLSEAVHDLPDGQYILPRFDLPEPLWEAWPRSDPQTMMQACDRLSRALHLDEVTISHSYLLFDAPGDFQLAPRQTLFDVCGFDERMIHGWHVDSNMCKRLYLLFGGRTESLAHRLKGYHCDHTRVATLAHRLDIKLENDLQEFVYGVSDPVAPYQAETWGAPAEPIEELDFIAGVQARYAGAVERALGAPQQIEYFSDSNELRNFVYYQPEHALPYLAGHLTTYPRAARLVYLGNGSRMLELTARCIHEMDFTHPLRYVRELLSAEADPDFAVAIPGGDLLDHDVLIFDFGLDPAGWNLGKISRVTDWPRELRYRLGEVARSLEICAEGCDAIWQAHHRTPDFIVLNANHNVFRQFAAQFLLATDTPYNTHVRKGRPRLGEERLYRSHAWKHIEDCMRSWFGYSSDANSIATAAAGHRIDFTSSGQSAGYKDGDWGLMDLAGTWTDGSRSSMIFSPPPSLDDDLQVHVTVAEAFLAPDSEPIRVQVLFEEELLVRWEVGSRYGLNTYKTLLPARLMVGKQLCRLTFYVENPQSTNHFATDPRELGVKIQRITFTETQPLPYSLGEQIDFTEAGKVAIDISDCWTNPDDLGTWTLGPDANYSLYLTEAAETPVVASFTISDVAVSPDYPRLNVEVRFNTKLVTEWELGPDRCTCVRRILVPIDILREQKRINISFHVDAPRTPVQLNWSSTDTRALGFRLTRLCLDAVNAQPYNIGEVIDLTGENPSRYLDLQWSAPDRYGTWTIGPEATMTMRFTQPPETGIAASFVISDCMVSESAPELPVFVKANGQLVTEWRLGPDRVPHRRSVHLPAEVVSSSPELTLTFEVPTPRSPAAMGWSADARPLGLRLACVLLGEGDLKIPTFEPSHDGLNGTSPKPPGQLRRLMDFALRRIRMAFRGTI